jgi:hypothetical protein
MERSPSGFEAVSKASSVSTTLLVRQPTGGLGMVESWDAKSWTDGSRRRRLRLPISELSAQLRVYAQ